VLNFGHTVAHAIEARAGFTGSHGEAVAVGMVIEARLGETAGVTTRGTADRIAAALARYQLPVALPRAARPAELLDAMRHDKKARAAEIRFALPARIGAMHRGADGAHTVALPDKSILEALEAGD
jgi:3-dehydroquinate synthase